jgi:hypothetical protein
MDDLFFVMLLFFMIAEGEDEAHVDREMNVWEAVALMNPFQSSMKS